MASRDFVHTETLRLAGVHKGDLLDTPLESRFNRIARVTRRALGVRAATISLLDDEREWIKAADGWDLRELQRSRSLVATLVTGGSPLVIVDTQLDTRCRRHHLVTRAPKVRFCAVYPLRDRDDTLVGALAAYDIKPRDPAEGNMLGILSDVGQLAQRELFLVEVSGAQEQLLAKLGSARRQALLDELTRVWNRRGGLQLLEQTLSDASRQTQGLGVCIVDLDHFKQINDTHGHMAGDAVLMKVAAALVDTVRPSDVVCRMGGEEFLLIIPDVTAPQIAEILERVRNRIATDAIRVPKGAVRLTVSLGACVQLPNESHSAEDLLRRADDALYRAKAAGRNVVVTS